MQDQVSTVEQQSEAKAHETTQTAEGKYMTFKLGSEEYGLEILKVRELIRLLDITRVPWTQDYIRGVINLRGKVIPVVDLRLKFSMDALEETEQTVIIVVQYNNGNKDVSMGILVDEVLEVISIAENQIEPPPDFGPVTIDMDFLMGIGKTDERVIMLLDIGKVLSTQDTIEIQKLADSKSAASN